MSKATELREQAAAKFREAFQLVDGKKADELTAEVETKFTAIMAEATRLDAEFQKAASTDEQFKNLRERLDFYAGKAGSGPIPWDRVTVVGGGAKSLGEQFVESPEYKSLVDSGALTSDNAKFRTEPFRPKATKAATDVIYSGAGPGGALVTPQYLPGVVPLPQRPTVVRDLFSQGDATSDVLSYARQTAFDTAAAPVAQATSAATGAKPQSSIAWSRVTSPIEAIATWMAATRRQLADAGQTRSLIDNQLQLMLKLVEDDQLINGSGVSPNLTGLKNVAGVQTLNVSASPSTSQFLNVDTIREAKRLTKTGAARLDADGVILNPVDAAKIDELKDNNSRYIGQGPFGQGPDTLWRMPRVESEAVAAGTAMVGAFKAGATVFQREGVAIFMADQHADFFIRNLVAVLAEERIGLAVFFPAAFVFVTFKAWP